MESVLLRLAVGVVLIWVLYYGMVYRDIAILLNNEELRKSLSRRALNMRLFVAILGHSLAVITGMLTVGGSSIAACVVSIVVLFVPMCMILSTVFIRALGILTVLLQTGLVLLISWVLMFMRVY